MSGGDANEFVWLGATRLPASQMEAAFREMRRLRRVRDVARSVMPMFTIDRPIAASQSTEQLDKRRTQISVPDALVLAAYETSVPAQLRRRLKNASGLAVVVTVPDSSWVRRVADLLSGIVHTTLFDRDGSSARNHGPSIGNDEVAAALAEGLNVTGVSHDPRLLPELLVASADIRLTIKQPDTATLARVMRHCLRGRVPKDLPDGLGAGLDFRELVASLRPTASPTAAIARLQAARARTSATADASLPSLDDALFYGEARDWGLALARDVADARQGLIAWKEVDRAAVLYGPPGTGKTWLARMIANACGLPIIESSIAELFATSSGYLDGVIKAQRALFAKAAAAAPCLLFLDEIDAVPNRATMSPRGKDWWLPVVNDFLLLLAAAPAGVITIGATNRLKDIDEAIMRPGRLERAIEIAPPATAEGLAGLLRFHLGGDLAGVDLAPIAQLGTGATAADAMNWVRAARRAARAAGRGLTAEDLIHAIAPPDSRLPELRRADAVHEAGHAVAAIALGLEEVGFVSIVRDKKSGGRTRIKAVAPTVATKNQIERYVTMVLAGRAAEVVALGAASGGGGGGPGSDLDRATRLIAAIHGSLGLGDTLVYRAALENAAGALEYDPTFRALVDSELGRLQDAAIELVERHRAALDAVAEALMQKSFLDGGEVQSLFDAAMPASPATQPAIGEGATTNSGEPEADRAAADESLLPPGERRHRGDPEGGAR